MVRRGFTIVELLIVIAIMGILLVLAVVNVRSTQITARDTERKGDVEAISLAMDNFYRTGLTSTANVPTITNLAKNPNAITSNEGWFQVFSPDVTRTNNITWNGQSNWTRYVWNGNNHSLTRLYITLGDLQNGSSYTASVLAGNNGSSTITGSIDFSDNTPVSFSLDPGEMKRIYASGSRVTYDSTFRFVDFNVGAGSGGMLLKQAMVTQGETRYDYFDGSSSNWAWNGSSNESTSFGPALATGSSGSYPGANMAAIPLLTTLLQDADPKIFTAPGQDDPLASFIPATNGVQTTSGVLPQPTINQYVYQPIDSTNSLCFTTECRKFNIYYRLEADNTVYQLKSKNQ